MDHMGISGTEPSSVSLSQININVNIFGEISFQECVPEGFTQVVYGDLVYKPKRVKGAANFFSSDSKIVK